MNIRIENLKVSLSGNMIVDDVTARCEKGQFLGIIGPNGSGKSTLLKTIYRVLSPCGGVIYLNDKPLDSYSYRESAQKMAVVSQHNYYNFDFTVSEVVLMGRSPHKKYMERDNQKDYQIVEEALKAVDMLAHKQRIFRSLSGGEQQRVILARALAQQADYLILDEPTNHLDIKHQIDILNLVKSIGFTVIAAIHDLNIAMVYCDYLYVLQAGKIVTSGEPKTIVTKDLIKTVYHVDATIIDHPEKSHKIVTYY